MTTEPKDVNFYDLEAAASQLATCPNDSDAPSRVASFRASESGVRVVLALLRFSRLLLILSLFLPLSGKCDTTKVGSVKDSFILSVWQSDRSDLPDYAFTTAAQTPDGYLWFGSFQNVSRFDGKQFTIFDASTTHDLPGDLVRALITDPSGALWAGTDKGVARWKDGQWKSYTSAQGLPPDGLVWSIATDSRSNVWACTGTQIYQLKDDRFVLIHGPDRGADNSRVNCKVGSDDTLWIYSYHYVGALRNGSWQPIVSGKDNYVSGVCAGANGGLWVTDYSHARLWKDGKWSRELLIPEAFRDNSFGPFEDSQGNLWLGGYDNGVVVFLTDGRVLGCTTADGLENNSTLTIFEDWQGQIWIGSNGGGLARLRIRNVTTFDVSEGLTQSIVDTMAEVFPGHYLVGTHGGGALPFDGRKFGPAIIGPAAPDTSTVGQLSQRSWVHSLVNDSTGASWAGTYGDGLFRYSNSVVEHFPLKAPDYDIIYAMLVDSKDRLWLGTEAGLVCRDKGQLTYYGTNSGLPSPVNGKFRSLAEDGQGNIWVGGPYTEPLRLEGDRFAPVAAPVSNGWPVYAFFTSRDGSLWISTSQRRLLRLLTGHWTVYAEKDGYPNALATAILEDDSGNIWLGAGNGIIRLSRATLDAIAAGQNTQLECVLFDKGDGMKSALCHRGFQPAGFKSSDGRLWFATMHGLDMVDPRHVVVKSRPALTWIEKAECDTGTILPLQRGSPPHFTVPPGSKRLTIYYAGIDLTASEDLQYQYRRDGLDKEWVNAGTEHVARLFDLRPGHYSFTVRASNKQGTWSQAQATVAFDVQPFVWQTAWFRTVALLLLMAGVAATVWGVVSARHRRDAQERALKEERAQSAALLKAKEATEHALRRFEAVLENASFVAIQGCDLHGTIVHWNAASEVLFGYSRKEALGARLQDLVLAKKHVAEFEKLLEKVRQTSQACPPSEWSVRARSGAERLVYLSAFAIRGERNAIEIFCMEVDITERKELEIELRQAQKMEAIGQLAGGVAHDFNNILTVIQGNVGLMLEDYADAPAEMIASLEEVAGAANRAANLIRQLLAFGRRQLLNTAPLELNQSVDSLSKMLRRVLGEHIALQVQFSPDRPWIMADPSMVEQIILNLAVNARDAMPNGGTLAVSTALIRVDQEYIRHHPEAREGEFARLSVADTGCGMAESTLNRIFEPFFTTKEMGKGTGLGLATVYGITKQHQGWVEVQSKPGQGAAFSVFFPTCPPGKTEAKAAPAIVRGGSETILVVEDEPEVRGLVRDCLRHYGYQVLEAGHGPEALTIWKQHREGIDLVLTDMVMPGGMSGGDLAKKLKQDRGGLRVLFSSGYSDQMAIEGVRLEKGDGYLAKPYDPVKLAIAVRGCLDG